MSSDEVMLLGPQTNDPQYCTLLASSFRMVNAVKKKEGSVQISIRRAMRPSKNVVVFRWRI